MIINIAICDDENYFTEELKNILSDCMLEKGLVFEIDTYSSGAKLISLGIGMLQYSIIFLDINMEKVDGIKAAEKIREISREVFIVFVTAYVNYSLEGYRLDAVRYLLKPVREEKFFEAMDYALSYMGRKIEPVYLLKTKDGLMPIPYSRIEYIENASRHLPNPALARRVFKNTAWFSPK